MEAVEGPPTADATIERGADFALNARQEEFGDCARELAGRNEEEPLLVDRSGFNRCLCLE